MPLTLSGSGGITYPDGSVNTTRSVSTAGDTMTGSLSTSGEQFSVNRQTASMARITLANTNRNWTISNYGTQFSPNGSLNIADETAGAVRWQMNTNGYVSVFNIPSFYARYASQKTKPAGWTEMPSFDYTDYNVGNHFSANVFTAPIAGLYQFIAGGFFCYRFDCW